MKRVWLMILVLALVVSGIPTGVMAETQPIVYDGNASVSAAEWPALNTDLTHIICYGQSFATGADAPVYPDAAVDGVYVFGNITNSSNGKELSPLATTGNQHPIISAGNVLAQLLAKDGYDTDIVLGSYGSGGRTIAQLMSAQRQAQIKQEEGYTYDCLSSGRYEVFQQSVEAIGRYAENEKKTVSCPVIVYLQGETDQNTDAQLGYPDNPVRAGYGAGGDKEKYKTYMSRLKEDMQRQVMETYGQTEAPLFMIYQVSGTYTRTKYSSINMAQIEFAQENEDVILVQTPYFTPHYTTSHHLTVNGYRWLGEYIARYIYTALVERVKPWPMLPDRFEIVGEHQIRVAVAGAQNGLSIDTYTVENATTANNLYGFNLSVDGKAVVPQSIATCANTIEIMVPDGVNLSAAASVYLYYAGQSAKGTGNIRDNCAEVGIYTYLDDSNDTGTGNNQGVSHSALDANGQSLVGQPYPLYNWLASFCYDIKTDCLHRHTYTEKMVTPTCVEPGYTIFSCPCGVGYKESYTVATGAHTYENGVCTGCGGKKEFKILLIGNSYSQDASNATPTSDSQMLNILQAMLGEDATVTVGLLYSGGKGMHWHATQSEQGTKAFSFRVITTENPIWKSLGTFTSADALAWTDWDAVSLQPYNINVSTGQESVPYPESTDSKFYDIEVASEYMLDYVARHAPSAEIYFYMHWAQTSSTTLNAVLNNYNKMAAFMPQVLDYVGNETGARFKTIVPVGLSIQNARTTYLALLRYNTTAYADGNLNLITDAQIGLQRDGGHVSYNIGRYIAALTFAEMVIPESMRVENYVLPDIRVTESVGKLPKEYTVIAQKSVRAAVDGWKNGSLAVTDIVGYNEDPTIAAKRMLENMTFLLDCAGADYLTEQMRSAVTEALPTDFVVDAVTFGADAEMAMVTIRFGYTSVDVSVSYRVATDEHIYEDGVCAGCGAVEPIRGDVDGDGRLNNRDLALMQRHLGGWDVAVTAEADMDGNGAVNNRDLGLLQRKLNGWKEEEETA